MTRNFAVGLRKAWCLYLDAISLTYRNPERCGYRRDGSKRVQQGQTETLPSFMCCLAGEAGETPKGEAT